MKTSINHISDKMQGMVYKLEELGTSGARFANRGLTTVIAGEVRIHSSIEGMIAEIKAASTENVYRTTLDVDDTMFLQIKVVVEYLTPEEIGKPLKVVRLARNLEGFDRNYQMSDDRKVHSYWSRIKDRLQNMVASLTETEMKMLGQLTIKTI